MSAARKPAIWPNALATAVAIAAGLTLSTYAQSGRTGGLVQYVGVELGSPFTAQWVTTSAVTGTDGRERTSQMVETAARDSSGRIRFEKLRAAIAGARDRPVTLYTHEGGTITTSENELHRLVSVYDTPESRIVTLQPGLHIAEVRAWDGKLPEVPGTRAYSSYSFPSTATLFL